MRLKDFIKKSPLMVQKNGDASLSSTQYKWATLDCLCIFPIVMSILMIPLAYEKSAWSYLITYGHDLLPKGFEWGKYISIVISVYYCCILIHIGITTFFIENICINIDLFKKIATLILLLYMDRKRFNKFEVEEKQFYFKKKLLRKVKLSSLSDMKDRNNLNDEGFPTVWLMVDCLTFGDSVHIVENMSLKNKRQIAKSFNCTPSELLSWLKCLNFIRDICAHNNDLIDISIITKPQPPKNYRQFLFKDGHRFTNKIAIAILIIKQLMTVINPKYSFNDIYHVFNRVSASNDNVAQSLGFKNFRAIHSLVDN